MDRQEDEERVLFEDKDVKITNKFVYIKWYFFPWGGTEENFHQGFKKVEKKAILGSRGQGCGGWMQATGAIGWQEIKTGSVGNILLALLFNQV